MGWFDINKLDDKTYIISENKHYEETNIYFLVGKNFNVCIDCGMGLHKIGPILDELDKKERSVILTHSHWDHLGNVDQFSKVYIHKKAKEVRSRGGYIPLEKVKKDIVKNVHAEYIPGDFIAEEYQISSVRDSEEISDGDVISTGDRELEIIYTPGHTPGSISIFEENTGYLFVGDFLYSGALYCTADNNDPDAYYESLIRLSQKGGKISKMLSGHYQPDLGHDYIDRVKRLFDYVKDKGMLKKGSGSHKHNGLEIVL